IVRSLGRHGIPVWVLKQNGHVLAALSRYAHRSLRWPAANAENQIDFLLELADKHSLQGWALFPTEDDTVALVARHHETLAGRYRVTVPPWAALRNVCDKWSLYGLARDLKIEQPWTVCPRNSADIASLVCSFPVILKPAMRVRPSPFGVDKAWRIDDRDMLVARYEQI